MTHHFIQKIGQAHQDKKNLWLFFGIDLALLIPITLLALYGLYILYSASGQNIDIVLKQGLRLILGFFFMCMISHISPSFWARLAPILYCIGLGLLMTVLLVGTNAKGAQRWISIPGLFRFQPSELMKLAIPLTLASLYARQSLPPSNFMLLSGSVLTIFPAALIAKQPDLGTALLIAYSGFMTLILAGLPWRYLALLGLLSVPSGIIFWSFFMHSYQKTRIMTLIDPSTDPLGAGWNIIQSKAAIGSGGLSGKGWLEGTQSQLHFLPESSTDFIIAVIAEELGFKGVLLLFLLYIVICARGLIIAWNAKDCFGRLLAGTLTLTFFIYIFVNVGMVSGILPVVGVPLPLISYGGSSIVSLMAGFGLIMSIHAHRYR